MSDNVHNEILEYISDSLKAQHSPKYERYIKYFNNISSILINNNDLQCSRVILSGSMAKDTAVHHKYDCDILVYMNMGSDYDRILMRKSQFIDKVGSILKQHLSGIHSTRSTPNSFQFSIGSFDFDILPVPNLLSDRKNEASHKTSFIQYTRAIQLCHLQRRPHMATFQLKAALSEYGDEFIKERSQFIHRLIILCKHWAHSRIFGGSRFSGLSSVIELIATWVGLNLEKKKQKNLLEGLKKFFEICSSIGICAIEFQLGKLNDVFRSSYVIVSRPYVKDPINPYNNRLYSVKSHQLDEIQRLGGIHLNLLNKIDILGIVDDVDKILSQVFQLQRYLTKENATFTEYKEFLEEKRIQIRCKGRQESNHKYSDCLADKFDRCLKLKDTKHCEKRSSEELWKVCRAFESYKKREQYPVKYVRGHSDSYSDPSKQSRSYLSSGQKQTRYRSDSDEEDDSDSDLSYGHQKQTRYRSDSDEEDDSDSDLSYGRQKQTRYRSDSDEENDSNSYLSYGRQKQTRYRSDSDEEDDSYLSKQLRSYLSHYQKQRVGELLKILQTQEEKCSRYFNRANQSLKQEYKTRIDNLIINVSTSINHLLTLDMCSSLQNLATVEELSESLRRDIDAISSVYQMVTFVKDSCLEFSQAFVEYYSANNSYYSLAKEIIMKLSKLMNEILSGFKVITNEFEKYLKKSTFGMHRGMLQITVTGFRSTARKLRTLMNSKVLEIHVTHLPIMATKLSILRLQQHVTQIENTSMSIEEEVIPIIHDTFQKSRLSLLAY